MRPARPEDAAQITALLNAEMRWLTGEDRITREELVHEWSQPGYTLERDCRVVELPDGRLAAMVEFIRGDAPYVRHYSFLAIHPELGRAEDADRVLGWLTERAREELPAAPPDTRVNLMGGALEQNTRMIQAWQRAGFRETRRFYHMRTSLENVPTHPELGRSEDGWSGSGDPPAGYEIRALAPGEEWDVFVTTRLSFRDHYGATGAAPDEEGFAEWKHHFIDGEHADRELLLVAVDDRGSIVGVCLSTPQHGPHTHRGWVHALGILPEHRRKGLGEAMLRRAFDLFRARGKTEAGLGVDASSLTNATRLYEKCGMYRHRVSIQFGLVLREGVELAKMA